MSSSKDFFRYVVSKLSDKKVEFNIDCDQDDRIIETKIFSYRLNFDNSSELNIYSPTNEDATLYSIYSYGDKSKEIDKISSVFDMLLQGKIFCYAVNSNKQILVIKSDNHTQFVTLDDFDKMYLPVAENNVIRLKLGDARVNLKHT